MPSTSYNTLSCTDRNYKRYAIKAAKELGYDKSVIEKIRKAKTDSEVERALSSAREEAMRV